MQKFNHKILTIYKIIILQTILMRLNLKNKVVRIRLLKIEKYLNLIIIKYFYIFIYIILNNFLN